MLRNAKWELGSSRSLPQRASRSFVIHNTNIRACCERSRFIYHEALAAVVSDAPIHKCSAHRDAYTSPVQDSSQRSRSKQLLGPTRTRTKQRHSECKVSVQQTKPAKAVRPPPASQLLKHVLDGGENSDRWKRKAAMSRSMRLPIVVLQSLIREEAQHDPGGRSLWGLLPRERRWGRTLETLNANGYTKADVECYTSILREKTDDERCQRFLEQGKVLPLFILGFLLRSTSKIRDTSNLNKIIDYCDMAYCRPDKSEYRVSELSHRANESSITANDFLSLVTMLTQHCIRLEPRLCSKLADLVGHYIEQGFGSEDREETFQERCRTFNEALQLFRPQLGLQAAHGAVPNAYFWEAQRKLLAMSAGLPRPLLVSGIGFRAIRDVLAGLPKNQTEVHSSIRHAPTWPPYLQPSDGMDEVTDPEDNWSRTVGAGMLMQEAGFSKSESDDALDILQGMAPDGTPTIQQRTTLGDWRTIGAWEASIRATRNAQEAWEIFQRAPKSDLSPGSDEYAAMFEKLIVRDATAGTKMMPGDKALNFPIRQRTNLAEIEQARLRPPSVTQLYEQMRSHGVRPQGKCLQLLVAHAESLDTAHRYLNDSTEGSSFVHNLMSENPDPDVLKKTRIGLFSAYTQVLSREAKNKGKHVRRAIRLAAVRLEHERSRWAPFVWGSLLKSLAQHHRALNLTFVEQINLLLLVMDRIKASHGVSLATFTQFNKCIRKAVRRELNVLQEHLPAMDSTTCNSLLVLYSREGSTENKEQNDNLQSLGTEAETPNDGDVTSVLIRAATRMKAEFYKLVEHERSHQPLVKSNLPCLDRMLLRADPVRSERALEYMLSLAYVGEFVEMERLLHWLIKEWSEPEVRLAVEELDEPPPQADFFNVLCVFRLFAEPVLGRGAALKMRAAISIKRLQWTWPEDEAMLAYGEMRDDDTIATLRNILEWTRYREGP